MTADAVNRDAMQVELARLLDLELVPDTVSRVYDYEDLTVDEQSCVMVLSAGTKRLPSGINDQRWKNYFMFEVLSFVRTANTLSNDSGGSNWTASDVERKLNLIDKKIGDVIADNRANPAWSYVEFADEFSEIVEGRSRVYELETQMTDYKIESRNVLVTYFEKG